MYILKNHLYESHEPRREGLSLIFPLTYQRNSGTLQYVIVNKKKQYNTSQTNPPSHLLDLLLQGLFLCYISLF